MSTELRFFHYTKGIIDRDAFCANHEELDKYVKHQMSQWEDTNLSRNYVALNANGECVAVFSLNAARLQGKNLPKSEEHYPAKLDLPTIKIGRLVVDEKYRDQGIGRQTLTKAIFLFIEVSKLVGAIGLTVDAKNEKIKIKGQKSNIYLFYEKYGFKRLTSRPKNGCFPMILHTSTIKRQFPSLFQTPV